MTLEDKLNARITGLTGCQDVNLAQELGYVATNHFASATNSGTSTFEVSLHLLKIIRETKKDVHTKTLYKLPFEWASCGYIKTIFEEINNRLRLVHIEFGRLLVDGEFEKMYDCDRFDYDDKSNIISFRPI